jgi:hypothetical protein
VHHERFIGTLGRQERLAYPLIISGAFLKKSPKLAEGFRADLRSAAQGLAAALEEAKRVLVEHRGALRK